MKIAFCADLHLANHRVWGGAMEAGLNRRAREALATLTRALARARALGCSYFVVLGDLYDSDRPTPQLVTAVQDILGNRDAMAERHDLHVIVLRGNHDATSDAPGDDALGPLDPVIYDVADTARVLSLADAGGRRVDLVAVPWRSGPAREWLPATLETLLGVQASAAPFPRRVLALHLGLVDGDSPPWLRDAPDAVPVALVRDLAKQYGISFVVAGNHHQHRWWSIGKGMAVQCGTLIPHSFSDAGFDDVGKLIIYDTETDLVEREVIPGPRFVTTRPDGRAGLKLPPVPEGSMYVRAVVAPEHLAIATEIAEETMRAPTGYAGVEVVADDAGVEQQARAAGASARNAGNLDEALAEYVGRMPLGEGVERVEVLERCRTLLK